MYKRIQQVDLRPDPEMALGSVTVRLQHLGAVKCLLQEWNLQQESWLRVYQMGIVHPVTDSEHIVYCVWEKAYSSK